MKGYKRVRRIVSVPCHDCYGTGKGLGGGRCVTCDGKGNVERVVVEVIHDESEVSG